ncbi:prominin-1-A-like isoform X2 [Ambystoma mexicanum]|uniref:prominin-1-A-like isoform X2 n=1 Tax=Ambystoma mexicanum TaxID=8296 RepID=UPI0037E83EE9
MEFQNFTSPTYGPYPDPPSGSTQVFSQMVHVFLGMVQPNAFPPDFLIPFIESNFQTYDVKQILWYEAGYLACVIIGVLFIILMPLVGFFFCCCRCCGNCGGKMYQEQTKRIKCKRHYHYIALFLVTIIILAGNICMFISNANFTDAVNKTFNSFNDTVNNVNTFLASVPQEINYIINSSNLPVTAANNSLQNIGPELGGSILNAIGTKAYPTLDLVSSMASVMYSSAVLLVGVNSSFNQLHSTQMNLSQQLSAVQKSINDTQNSPSCTGCNSSSANDLTFNANFNTMPDFSSQYKLLADLNATNIPLVLQEAKNTLSSIPQQVTNQTKSTVSDVQNQLKDINSELQNVNKDLSFTDSLKNISKTLQNATTIFFDKKPQIEEYDHIRWIIGICLSCIVLLIVICNLFGFLLGPIGLKPNVDPTNRSSVSNAGGDFFMAGAGFSFIFSWLLMIVVLVVFLVGGNSYTIICKPWDNQQIFKVIDTPGLIPSFNLSQMLGLKDVSLNVSTIYSECQNNQPMWGVLHLDQVVPLEKYLNISKYEGNINSTFNQMNITLDPITFLTDNQKDILRNISSSGIDTLNFTEIQNQAKKNVTKVSLTEFANALDTLANSQADSTVKESLKSDATTLRSIDNAIKSTLQPQIATMTKSITDLQATTSKIPNTVNSTLSAIDSTQNFINTQAAIIVKSESRTYMDRIMGYFPAYIKWANTTLRYNAARCGPLGKAANSTYVLACDYVVDSLNAFWFSLGWCTIFLLPGIILSVKLAKYYRRMKKADVYENNNIEMTTNSEQFLIPRAAMKK